MTAVRRVVLDASVLVRSVVDPQSQGGEWVTAVDLGKVDGHTAVLVFSEVANALAGYVRAGALAPVDATEALDALGIVPFELHGAELAPAALKAALKLDLSAYDGTYAALAESLDAPLITADRRLAAAVQDATLID